jgi:hypothetical protein
VETTLLNVHGADGKEGCRIYVGLGKFQGMYRRAASESFSIATSDGERSHETGRSHHMEICPD